MARWALLQRATAARTQPAAIATRTAASAAASHGKDGHGDHHYHHDHHHWPYNEPSGWLFGYKPGYRRKWYWWEPIYYPSVYGGFLFFALLWNYRYQKTPLELAKEEAHRRLALRGEEFGYPLPPDYSPYRRSVDGSESSA